MRPATLAIKTENLTKRFQVVHDRPERVKDLVISKLTRRKSPVEELLALDCVNLEISRGESVGIVGPNGSGTTTLLGLLCRVTPPRGGRG